MTAKKKSTLNAVASPRIPSAGTAAHRPVRMRDVAELANVGTMTVSRVLNGTARVAEDTSRRVYAAIEQLQYMPNPVARALRGSPSLTIGVLLPYLYDPFFASCAHAINAVAQQRGYSVILMTTNEDPASELDEIRQMVRRKVDGLILIPVQQKHSGLGARFPLALSGGVPVVTLDRPILQSNFDHVEVENETGGFHGTEHLIAHGYHDICFLGLEREGHTMFLRHRGYKRAMNDAGLVPEAYFDCGSQPFVTRLLRRLFAGSRPPRAIFTANGLVTRYALKAFAELGVSIPTQIAILAFDDLDLAELLEPPLSVLRQPTRELGREAAELLFDRLTQGEKKKPQHTRVLPVELVLRGSCGCRP